MALFGKIFCFYAVVFIALGILILKVRKRLGRRTAQPREEAPPAYRTYREIMEEKAGVRADLTVDEKTYVSPCLSCTKVIDPLNCTGCSIARPNAMMEGRGTRP